MTDKNQTTELEPSDLEKALQNLAAVEASDGPTRRQVLLKKAQETELSDDELTELQGLLGSERVSKSEDEPNPITEPFTENESLNKSVDVSGYLRDNHDALVKSLTAVSDAIEGTDTRQFRFNIELAKAVKAIGETVVEQNELLKSLAGQPARGPKGRVQRGKPAQPLAKSFGESAADESQQFSKSQYAQALDDMFKSSVDSGNGGFLPGTTIDLQLESAKFESTAQLNPVVAQAVHQKLTGQTAH